MPRECSAAYEKRFLFRFLIIPKSLHWPGARAFKVRFIERSSITNSPPTGHEKETRGCKKQNKTIPDHRSDRLCASPSTTNPSCDRNKAKSWLQRGAEGSVALALASVRGQQKVRVVVVHPRPSLVDDEVQASRGAGP